MYIQRSVLLLVVLIYLLILAGISWVNGPDAGWYRPFLLAFSVIFISAIIQRLPEQDDF